MKKYLLERYPAIWNIQIVWLFPLILLSHLVFFGLGFIMLTDSTLGNSYYLWGNLYNGLPMLLNFIIIVLLLVGCLIYLFRNNAFERFYPVSRWQLFGRFVAYLVIIFGMTSTHISFIAGEKAKVHWRYSDSYIHSILQQYPENFDSSYEEVQYSNKNKINEFFITRNAKNMKTNTFIEIVKDKLNTITIIVFVLTLLLFTVRITSLRTVLLAIVFGGLFFLFIHLLSLLILYLVGNINDLFTSITITCASFLVLLGISVNSKNKLYRKIAINNAIYTFLPTIAVIFTDIVDKFHLWHFIEDHYGKFWDNLRELLFLDIGILLTILFIGLYTGVIKRCKAMPE